MAEVGLHLYEEGVEAVKNVPYVEIQLGRCVVCGREIGVTKHGKAVRHGHRGFISVVRNVYYVQSKTHCEGSGQPVIELTRKSIRVLTGERARKAKK